MRSSADTVRGEAEGAIKRSKLADLRVRKAERDGAIAMRMAVLRDQLHFSLAFYVSLVVATGLRCIHRRRLEGLPLSSLPLFAGPFIFAYNVDAAYGNKVERLNMEAQTILRTEAHWFNQPMILPTFLEPEYRKMREENNRRLHSAGMPPESDWATFRSAISDDEVWQFAAPLSKLMHESLADDVNVDPERGLLGLMRNRIVSIVRAADGHATFTARTALDPPDVTLRTHASVYAPTQWADSLPPPPDLVPDHPRRKV
ncbi:hypothetical protein EMIHUDRAFT_222477 [Emiliania huxleyi CCMP1516]|jgi:hypothetical protein|uniref:Uncharacterized protein n=2 Tax=Emiliania huxleyi TaxID=2903 RepID=A0A0D3KY87_EMIH1|nr:hypothetical protein EMIHUDRAFT_222477 [Emiliania huxleyi CCMP1516]EOD40722.1 hypothetical protein EMIHUDRAFT_222477 [Emiliania huxleyi CCMP1516]|eukprot:XP_005793151.1 hypothetical protein EMIHUDRAFT_222477 [Emiliania huxleyi CCMP1516]